jgi:PKD repeat protein
VQGNIVATPILPPAGTGPGEAGAPEAGQEENEGDCIVVADADPDYGPPPLAVTFSAEAECNAGQPTFKWNFGDGSAPSTEPNPTHTYSRPGDYTASVSITGPGGSTASDEVDITVEEEEGATEPEE